MAAFVTVTEISSSSGTASGTVTSTAHNALICTAGEFGGTGPTLAMSGGGTWTTDKNTSVISSMCIGHANTPNATGGSQTITSTWSGTSVGFNSSFIMEFSGMATSSMLDLNGTTNNGNSAALATSSLTNSNASDVMIASGWNTGSVSAPSFGSPTNGWTIATQDDNQSDSQGWCAYLIVSTSASQSTTVTNAVESSAWVTFINAYKQAASGGIWFMAGMTVMDMAPVGTCI